MRPLTSSVGTCRRLRQWSQWGQKSSLPEEQIRADGAHKERYNRPQVKGSSNQGVDAGRQQLGRHLAAGAVMMMLNPQEVCPIKLESLLLKTPKNFSIGEFMPYKPKD